MLIGVIVGVQGLKDDKKQYRPDILPVGIVSLVNPITAVTEYTKYLPGLVFSFFDFSSGILFDIKQRSLYPRTMTFRAPAGLVQFILIKGKITLPAVCGCNNQTIIGMIKTLDKMPEVIRNIFLRYLQMPGDFHQVHGTIFE